MFLINNYQMVFTVKQFCRSLQKMRRKVNNSIHKAKCLCSSEKGYKNSQKIYAMHPLYSREKIADKLALQNFL